MPLALTRPVVLAGMIVGIMLAGGPPVAQSQDAVERIAAVVNEDVISTTAVDARVRLGLLASGLAPTAENIDRVRPQVLRGLIDERLRLQEADRLNLVVEGDDISAQVADIAQQNGLTADQFVGLMDRAGVPLWTLEEQIRAQLAWNQLVSRRVLPTVRIGEEEIDETITRLQASQGTPEYLLANIFLAVDNPANEAEVAAFAQQIVEEIGNGAPFGAVARQFSDGVGAAAGGDMGWVLQGQLEPALDEALPRLTPGQVSDPIRGVGGYHILLLRQQRQASVPDVLDTIIRLGRLGLPLPANPTNANLAVLIEQAQQIASEINGCEQMQARADDLGLGGIDGGTGRLGDLPEGLRNLLDGLEVGQPSEPQRLADGVGIFMVCERRAPTDALDRDRIRGAIGDERVDMLQRRYLRDLRNAAYIEIRS